MGCRKAAEVEGHGGCDRENGRATYAQGRMNGGQEVASTLGHRDSVPLCQVTKWAGCLGQVLLPPRKTDRQTDLQWGERRIGHVDKEIKASIVNFKWHMGGDETPQGK